MTTIQTQDTFRWNLKNQYFATILVNIITFSMGCMIGWGSCAIPILASPNTPISAGPLTNEEISWIGSIDAIGSTLGALIFGYFASIIGPKRILLLLTLPTSLLFWLLIYIGNTFYHILFAKFTCGFVTGGILLVVILFVSEIANDDIRGQLATFFFCFRNVGVLFAYILGTFVEYEYVPCISCLFPIIFFASFVMLPNTPQYYLEREKFEEAEKAIRFYKRCKGNDELEEKAIQKEFERLKVIMSERKESGKINMADICCGSTIKGFFIALTIAQIPNFTCCFIILNYSVITFAKVGQSVDPYMSMILSGVALCCGALISAFLADTLGRRKLNIISVLGSALGLLITVLYKYFSVNGYDLSAFAYIPLIGLSFTLFISSAGIIPTCGVCMIEYLSPKIRTYGMGLSCSISNILIFISLKYYPILLESLDLHGCLAIYTVFCFLGFIFIFLVLDDTSGTSLDDVGLKKTKIESTEI